MRLRRLVLAGLVGGAVAGFLIALLRPRGTHPAVVPVLPVQPGVADQPYTEVAPGSGAPPVLPEESDGYPPGPDEQVGRDDRVGQAWEPEAAAAGSRRQRRPQDSDRPGAAGERD
jgi:hypothetical protein